MNINKSKSECSPMPPVLIYERENKPCLSLELSHIQFINYSLHIVDQSIFPVMIFP
jgi:hypothetical protein